MRNVAVFLPGEGVHYRGPRPLNLDVREVPNTIMDEELERIVRELAAHPRGLTLGDGDGSNGSHRSLHVKTVLAYAKERGIAAPEIPSSPVFDYRRAFRMADGTAREVTPNQAAIAPEGEKHV